MSRIYRLRVWLRQTRLFDRRKPCNSYDRWLHPSRQYLPVDFCGLPDSKVLSAACTLDLYAIAPFDYEPSDPHLVIAWGTREADTGSLEPSAPRRFFQPPTGF